MHDVEAHSDQHLEDGSDSSDGEGWLSRFDGDDDAPAAEAADVRDSIRLPGGLMKAHKEKIVELLRSALATRIE